MKIVSQMHLYVGIDNIFLLTFTLVAFIGVTNAHEC